MKVYLSAILLAALGLSAVPPGAGATEIAYTVTEIPSLPDAHGRPLVLFVQDLNDKGRVVGYMYDPHRNRSENAFITGPNGIGLQLLVGPPNEVVRPLGVNDSGQVTGTLSRSVFTDGFLTDPNAGAFHRIGSLGGVTTFGEAVNNHGQVTGDSSLSGELETHAFLTAANGGALKDLGTLGGTFSEGREVNESGQVAGFSFLKGDTFGHAFLSDPNGGPIHDLGTLGGKQSGAEAVNDAGQVAGFAYLKRDVHEHAFLSGPNGGPLLDLGTLGGSNSLASDVNDSGMVVGFSYLPGDHDFHTFVYSTSFGMQDLNDLIDPQLGIELIDSGDINNRGQILTGGIVDGRQGIFLLTPIAGVPDSGSTGCLFAFALGGLSLLRRWSHLKVIY